MDTYAVKETDLAPLVLEARGKVRDVYRVDDKLLIVSTDRLSAFDVILPDPIPLKGKVVGSTFSFTYGSGRSGAFVLAPDGKSFSGSFTDLESNHRGNFSGSR